MITNEMLIIAALAVLVLTLIGWVIRIEMRMRRVFRGRQSASLEDVIASLVATSAALEGQDAAIMKTLANMDARIKKSIRSVETVRFNPFRDSGGNHSFATAFVSEDGDGVVLSSLYARDRVNIFAKPVKGHASEFELTEEEKAALSKAK